MRTITQFKIALLTCLISSIPLVFSGCPNSLDNNGHILEEVFNGPIQHDNVKYEIFREGRAFLVFAKMKAASRKEVNAVVADATLYLHGDGSTRSECDALHEALEDHVRAIVLSHQPPKWFSIPEGQAIRAVYERKTEGATVRYILDSENTLWIYGIGEHWSERAGKGKADTY